VLYAPKLGCVLDILPDRLPETLEQWFDQRGSTWCAQVEVFCADRWDAYHPDASAKLSHARQVVDHFHVTKNLNGAISKTRRTVQNTTDPEAKAVLKGSRWPLLKNPATLSDKERTGLAATLAASPALATCYKLKEAFRQWMHTDQTPQVAANALEPWLQQGYDTPYKALHAFANTVTR